MNPVTDNGLGVIRLNESPSQKEGKFRLFAANLSTTASLNESPSQKEGKCRRRSHGTSRPFRLNESPSQKEGKYHAPG